jgi:hypothetical protein
MSAMDSYLKWMCKNILIEKMGKIPSGTEAVF